jgi:hypothetical protein
MASKSARALAYDAGRAAFESEPPDRRHPDSCPFSPLDQPEERAEWLRGFGDVLDEATPVEDLRAALKESKAAKR